MTKALGVEYFSSDFDYDDWSREASSTYKLPLICQDQDDQLGVVEKSQWELFFGNHNSGNFFRPRNYLFAEFQNWLSLSNTDEGCQQDSLTVVEVGCGHGSSMYPLIKSLPFLAKYTATDYSLNALAILEKNPSYDKNRITTAFWDVTKSPDFEGTFQTHSDALLCIFALSAVKPEHHVASLRNMAAVLKPNGVILFRDYGLHDMTMYRHTKRYAEKLFERNDKTLSYYFDLDYMREIVRQSGLIIVELSYATVEVQNRRMANSMKRVFVHAVIKNDVSR